MTLPVFFCKCINPLKGLAKIIQLEFALVELQELLQELHL